jgi:hypothetical protein
VTVLLRTSLGDSVTLEGRLNTLPVTVLLRTSLGDSVTLEGRLNALPVTVLLRASLGKFVALRDRLNALPVTVLLPFAKAWQLRSAVKNRTTKPFTSCDCEGGVGCLCVMSFALS